MATEKPTKRKRNVFNMNVNAQKTICIITLRTLTIFICCKKHYKSGGNTTSCCVY
jgi:hypothetical protein